MSALTSQLALTSRPPDEGTEAGHEQREGARLGNGGSSLRRAHPREVPERDRQIASASLPADRPRAISINSRVMPGR